MLPTRLSLIAIFLLLAFGAAHVMGQAGKLAFTDLSTEVGIDFMHTDGGTGQRYVVESMSAGLALFDFDGDGLEDIYFLNGSTLDPKAQPADARNALYRNLGNWQFEEVGRAAGVDDAGYGLGVVAGDYDGDGDADLYVTNYGPNVFYENQADGTFRKITGHTGTSDGDKFGAGAVFFRHG